MTKVEKYFEEVEETLRLKFRGWEVDLPHPGEKGGVRERRVKDLLSSVLPKRCGIGTGHIVDSQGNISAQTDLVIYDAADGIVLPIDDYYSLFPCESVYAAVEVKSELTAGKKGTISQCVESTRKLKSLKRENCNSRIHSVVFAYKTSDNWRDPVRKTIEWFARLGKPYSEGVPDTVFVLSPGFFFYPVGPSGYCEDDMSSVDVFDRAPLLGFISHLGELLSPEKVVRPSFWPHYIEWKPRDVIAKVYPFKA